MTRLDELRRLAAAQPADPLPHLGVGMECMNLERWEEALAAFDQTLRIDPGYTAAWLQRARALLQLQRREEARAALEAGIKAARAQNDAHAADEMQKLLETMS